MSDPFVGQISLFAGTFAPRGYAFCDGQLMAINQNQALYSLIGNTYGGDGRTTFALPDLRGRIPVHQGQGPGLSKQALGQHGGVEGVTLDVDQMPAHTHAIQAANSAAKATTPTNNVLAESDEELYNAPGEALVDMNTEAIVRTGGSQSHSNMMPFLGLHFIIATTGLFPSRN
ncbi:MAG: tail fiber protein [Mariprofundaceae bacterium]